MLHEFFSKIGGLLFQGFPTVQKDKIITYF